MREVPRRILALLLLLFATGEVRAQEVQVEASADPARVEEGSSLTFNLRITGTSQALDETPDLSQIPGFVTAAGPSRSSYFQWVNGRTTSSLTLSWTLVPQGTGQRTIPPIAVTLGGKVYRTDPVRVDVVPRGSSAPPGGPPSRQSPFANPELRRRLAPPPTVPASLFVEAAVDKTEAYPGEQVTVEYKVYSQFEIAQMSLKDPPTFQGSWVEELPTDDHYDARPVTRPEGRFTEYTVLRKALFPTNPGSVVIPPLTFHFAARRRGGDPFDSFFFQPTESLYRSSEPVTIRVKDLPEQGRPPEFNGAVGRFTLRVTADRKEAKVNDAVGLKVVVEGQGNIDTLGSPAVPDLPDFKRYDPKMESSKRSKGSTVVGEKTWSYVLIPLAPGRQEIPSVRFAFFDPKTAQYRVLASEPIPMTVDKGTLAEMAAPHLPDRSEIAVLGQDIRYIKLPEGRLVDQGGEFYRSRIFLAVLVLPLLANVGLLAGMRWRSAEAGHAELSRRRRARKTARRKLRRARTHLSPDQFRPFYQELSAAMTTYLADKLVIPASGLTYDRIEEILERRGVDPDLRSRFRRCLENSDFARFAPGASERSEMERALQEAEKVVEEMEGSVKAG